MIQHPVTRSGLKPKTVHHVVPVELFTVTFTDGEGKDDTRLVMRRGNTVHFVHPDGVDKTLRRPTEWLTKAILERISKIEKPVSIPDLGTVELPENPIGA